MPPMQQKSRKINALLIEDDSDEARQKGARDYLVKGDIDGEMLTRLIREVLE